MSHHFITIEGSEGVGKSTALSFIQTYLMRLGKAVVVTREPGGTPLAEEMRTLLLHPKSGEMLQPETELLLMFAARAQHLSSVILPALQTGKWVLSDRFIDASYAYQGGGRGIPMAQIKTLDRFIVGNAYPALTFLLDMPVDEGFARKALLNETQDRIEKEQIDFFVRVRAAYLARAKAEPNRIKLIDASLAKAAVEAQIEQVLNEFLIQQQGKSA